jgi:hypothetical protein
MRPSRPWYAAMWRGGLPSCRGGAEGRRCWKRGAVARADDKQAFIDKRMVASDRETVISTMPSADSER